MRNSLGSSSLIQSSLCGRQLMTSSKHQTPLEANMNLGSKSTCILADRLGTQLVLAGQALESGFSPLTTGEIYYRFATPRTILLTFFLFEPRGSVRFALGAAFLRAARFSIFRSFLSSILVVSATCNLFRCNLFRGFSTRFSTHRMDRPHMTYRITGFARL